MQQIPQFFIHTPWWVYVLFVYLVLRGMRGLKPGETTLTKLAVMPVAFTVWGGFELLRLYGMAADAVAIWVVGLAIGTVIGFMIVRNAAISVDHATGVIHHPRDLTLLPLIILIFIVKYTFGAIGSISPDLLMERSFRFADLGLTGLFTGTFIGKFSVYASRYFSATATT
jgi:hypothetical protein